MNSVLLRARCWLALDSIILLLQGRDSMTSTNKVKSFVHVNSPPEASSLFPL